MLIAIVQTLFPKWHNRIWNEEFNKQMEVIRSELHQEFPDNPDVVNTRVDEAKKRWMK